MKYTKVIIKSKDDLPKETGGYFVFDKTFSFQSDYFNNDDKSKERWLKNYNWYLIEDTEKSYPEEFMKWCLENVSIDEKHGSEVYVLYTFGDRLMFPNMEKLHEYWLNEIKNK